MTRRLIPVNFTEDVRVYFKATSGVPHSVTPDAAASIDFRDSLPVHRSTPYPHRRNYEGHWWHATTRTSVSFESLAERDFLLWSDWDPDVVAVFAQPFAFQWPKDTPGHDTHVPDYVIVRADRTMRVVDVRPAERIGDRAREQFRMSAVACSRIGWEYEVWTGFPAGHEGPLRWLSGFRKDRYAPRVGAEDALVRAYARPTGLADGLTAAQFAASAPGGRVPAGELRGNVYYLLWHHRLVCDVTRPLSDDTEVVAA